MIGVIGILAVLAALLIPKIAAAISDSRITNAVESYQSLQTAAVQHYAKYYAFNAMFTTNATPAELLNWDASVLIPEGFLDQPFFVKLGSGQAVQVVAGPGNGGSGYLLNGTNNFTANNAFTAECVVSNVAQQDAYDIAVRLDGSLTPAAPGNLTAGRVVYTVIANGLGTMHMYLDGY
jgi:type II secretory pathway pseudopilin PulG